MALVTDLGKGFHFAFQGVTFLGHHRSLWKWALLPIAVNILVFAATFALFLAYYGTLYNLATGFFYPDSPEAWYAWLWVAPLRVLAWSMGVIILAAALAILYCAFLLLGTTIAAPFLAVLAQRVEAIHIGQGRQESTTFWQAFRSVGVTLVDELRKLAFFIGLQVVLLLLGLIPVLSLFMVMVAALCTMFFLPLEYAGFAMDSRDMRFADRRRLMWQHRWLMLGFGAAAFLTLLIPGLNFICLPVLVVGGTLLIEYSASLPHSPVIPPTPHESVE